MSGHDYSRDVIRTTSSTGESLADYTHEAVRAMGRYTPDRSVLPYGRILRVNKRSPIVKIVDSTVSTYERGYTAWQKAPMCWDQMQKYLIELAMSFALIADAKSDRNKFQISDFESVGNNLDAWFSKMSLEDRYGGPWIQESYELAAYMLARRTEIVSATQPFLFFIADETFYPEVAIEEIRSVIGGEERDEVITTEQIFRELRQKFNVFLIHLVYGAEHEGDFGYLDQRILRDWEKAVGPKIISPQHIDPDPRYIITPQQPKEFIDDILGVLALGPGGRTLEEYAQDMKNREQSDERVEQVMQTIGPLYEVLVAERGRSFEVTPREMVEAALAGTNEAADNDDEGEIIRF